MSQIEIPDWVVEIALKGRAEAANQPPKIVDGYYHFPTAHDAMRSALSAALERWLVPRGYLITWHSSGEQVVSARPAHQDDGKTDTLYLFRKEPAA